MIGLATTFDRAGRLGGKLSPAELVDRTRVLLERAGISEDRQAIVLDAQLDLERLSFVLALLEKSRALRVLAIEAQSGLRGHASLAALDREEARLAVTEAEATLRRAASVGASYVVVRLGWVEGARRDWVYARDQFLRAKLSQPREMMAARDHDAAVHVDRARSALDRLCRFADSFGVTLLVKNGQRYVELPTAAEWTRISSELAGAPVRPLFDLPAAHLPALMGFQTLAVTEATFGKGPLSYAGDACGAVAALPPGRGEIGIRKLTADALAFRPWPTLSEEEIVLGLRRIDATAA